MELVLLRCYSELQCVGGRLPEGAEWKQRCTASNSGGALLPPTTPLEPLVPTHYLVLTDMTCKLHQVVLAPRKEVGGAGGVGTSGT